MTEYSTNFNRINLIGILLFICDVRESAPPAAPRVVVEEGSNVGVRRDVDVCGVWL